MSLYNRTSNGDLYIRQGRRFVKASMLAVHENVDWSKYPVPEEIDHPKDAAAYFRRDGIMDAHQEHFHVLFLDHRGQVVGCRRLFSGCHHSSPVSPRVIAKHALELGASSVILGHNHPSGVAEPSPEDIEITKRVTTTLALLDICVLDHLIIGTQVFSLKQHGLFESVSCQA